MAQPQQSSIWIFGYGSLVWRPVFKYEQKIVGCIRGFTRRFAQGSTDHRGVPGNPGRVVTLLKSQESTWGVCYEIAPERIEETLSYLDYREKGGYTRVEVDVFSDENPSAKPHLSQVLLYYADETNPNFLGEAPELEIARTIVRSVGPSGKNIEYLLELAKALRALEIDDAHVFSLEKHALALLANPESPAPLAN